MLFNLGKNFFPEFWAAKFISQLLIINFELAAGKNLCPDANLRLAAFHTGR